MTVYGASAARDGTGWFFGLTGPQLMLVLIAAAPCWLSMAAGQWLWLLVLAPAWACISGLICVPVRGFTAIQWTGVVLRSSCGRALGWTHFQSRAAAGLAESPKDDTTLDLPGVLAAIQIHDGPPMLGRACRPAIIQDHASRTWGATGRIVHPGIGMSDEADRDLIAAGLAEMLESSSAAGEVSLIALQVRSLPDDGVERAAWVDAHRHPEPPASRQLHDELDQLTDGAAVRSESFVTVLVDEGAIHRNARRAGGGMVGRARALYGHLDEISARLSGAIGCTEVEWLESPALARAIRTGFEPGDAALYAQRPAPGLPLSAAGPSLASTALRHYRHGDWASSSSTVLLPANGAAIGALARVLVPSQVGERRSFTVYLQPIAKSAAERSTSRSGMSAAMAAEMRRKVGRSERARDRRAEDVLRHTDEKLERGRALVRVSTAAAVTVPGHWPIGEYARRLDSSIRLAGFVPLPLDGAHDAAFAAASIPLGVGLPVRRR